MAQLSYTQGFTKAYDGQLADGKDFVIDAYKAGGALAFGRGVIRGANDSTVVLGAAAGLVRGIAVRTQVPSTRGAVTDLLAGDMVSVMRRGRVFCEVSVAVTAEQPAYISTAVNVDQGKLTNVSASNLLVGKFMTAGADGDFVEVDVQFV